MRTEAELDELYEMCERDCPSAQIGDEFRRLFSLLNRLDVRSVIEIGSEEGGTIRAWTALFPELTLFNIDLNSYDPSRVGDREALQAKWRSWLGPRQFLDTVWGNSHDPESRERLLGLMPLRPYVHWTEKSPPVGQVDMLYIDGDHSEAGVEMDYRMYGPLVRPGGVIVFNDIHPYEGREAGHPAEETVWRFWERLKGPAVSQWESRSYVRGRRPNWLEICHDCQSQQSFGFGILFV